MPWNNTGLYSALRSALGNDGVHFSAQGRHNLFTNLAKTIYGLKNGALGKPPNKAEAAASIVSGRKYYWRGSLSEGGSSLRPASMRGGARDAVEATETTDHVPLRTTSRSRWDEGAVAEAAVVAFLLKYQ
jgi:hypothetical protein